MKHSFKILSYYTLIIGGLLGLEGRQKEMIEWGDWAFLLGIIYVILGGGAFWIALSFIKKKVQKTLILSIVWILYTYIIAAGLIKAIFYTQNYPLFGAILTIPMYVFITWVFYNKLFKK
ncbi:hypothetical protein JKY72_04005 [Candidatus Gracilibacteria bacterium]|nr:hypothetical protein [Candidatus Gracilibacteria bacterium]